MVWPSQAQIQNIGLKHGQQAGRPVIRNRVLIQIQRLLVKGIVFQNLLKIPSHSAQGCQKWMTLFQKQVMIDLIDIRRMTLHLPNEFLFGTNGRPVFPGR